MAIHELPPPMSHLTADDLALFVDGELSAAENRAVVRHLLTGCRRCVAIAQARWAEIGGRGLRRRSRMPNRFAAFEAQLREVAGGLRDRFAELARLVEALPSSAQETSLRDLDEDPDWPGEARAVALCVMNDYLRPAVRDLLAAADYRPGEPLVPAAERAAEFRQVFDLDLAALGRGEPGRREESR